MENNNICAGKKDFDSDIVFVLHVTGTGSGLLGEIPRVVVQKSALL
jgi:hypothetical protein